MSRLLLIKLLRDLKTTWGRTLMMVLAITISLVAFGSMLYAYTLASSNTELGYMSTNPSSARITLEKGVVPEKQAALIASAKQEPGVIDATLRSTVSLEWQQDDGSKKSLELFVSAPDDQMKIAGFKMEQGSWPITTGSVVLERSTLAKHDLKIGDTVKLLTPNEKLVSFTVAGSAHDQSLAPAGQNEGYGYITSDSLPLLDMPNALGEIAITVADQPGGTVPSRNRDTVVRVASSLSERLEQNEDIEVEHVAAPTPYVHPHAGISNTILGALLGFGTLALLLSAILVATLFNGLLTQQIPQIGMLKSIGARSSQIMGLYLLMVLFIAGLATLLAFGPSIFFGKTIAQVIVDGALNIDITSLAIPLWGYATVVAAGIGVPLLIALFPLVSAAKRTVRQALDDRGVNTSEAKTSRLNNWLSKRRHLDRILLMAFRNVSRHRARFLLSAGLLAAAGTIFVAGMNMTSSMQSVQATLTQEQRWDVVANVMPTEAETLKETTKTVAGIENAETWNSTSIGVEQESGVEVTNSYPDKGHGSLNLSVVPPSTTMVSQPRIIEGRWLNPDEVGSIVLPTSVRKDMLPDAAVGQTIQLTIDDKLTSWKIVGIAEELASRTCPCVTQAGYEAATGVIDKANVLRLTTDKHNAATRTEAGEAVKQALQDKGIKVQSVMSIDAVATSSEEHSGLLLYLVLMIAVVMGVVGLVGLGSTMSTSVIERTREFGVMSAIGASSSVVRRLVIFEGVFIAIVSCVIAILPALGLTWLIDTVLGQMFYSAPLPVVVSLPGVVMWVGIVLIGAILATLTAAFKASRLTVREALAYL